VNQFNVEASSTGFQQYTSPSLYSLDFLSDNNIDLFHYAAQSLSRGTAAASVSEDIVVMALKKILDRSSHPILVCCNLGRHHTGVLRIVQCVASMMMWAQDQW
jgi:hypothetical protein